jgi:DNA-directed RNA polymerase subunit M/transcription elongation factor TFIIS
MNPCACRTFSGIFVYRWVILTMETLEQLQKTYALMTDEEIVVVASDACDLTETAQQALRAEIARRGLKITPQPAAARPEPAVPEGADEDPDADLEVVASARNGEEARLLQAALNSAGIRSCLGPDNAFDVVSFRGVFDKPVAIKVYLPFSEKALRVIERTRRDMPREFQQDAEPDELEGVAEEDLRCTARCPKCHSEEIVFESRAAEPGSEPGPDAKFDWRCDACGHAWEDDGVEDTRA